jgi:hypothetical protein
MLENSIPARAAGVFLPAAFWFPKTLRTSGFERSMMNKIK